MSSQKDKDRSVISNLVKDAIIHKAPTQKTVIKPVKNTAEERQLNFWVPKEFKIFLNQYTSAQDITIKDFMIEAAKEYLAKRNVKLDF